MKNPKRNKFLKRFDGGNRTPQEYHRAHAFPPAAKCSGCGGPPAVRAVVLAPFDEVSQRGMLPHDELVNPSILQTVVPLKGADGQAVPHVRLSITYSCSRCRREFERALAKAPSWCFVDINEGPDPTNRVQVGVS
jgi:hypothetical protein